MESKSGRDEAPPLSSLKRFRLKTIDLYVARQFLVAYAICGVSFLGLFAVIEAFSKLERFLNQESNFLVEILRYNLAMVPTVYTNYMGPIITLGAAMFTLTTLTRQNELSPLKAAGISIYRICLPIFLLAVCMTGITFVLQEQVIPRCKQPIREALAVVRGRPLQNLLCHDNEHGYLIGVREYSPTQRIARDVDILERFADGQPKKQIDANQMEWIPSSDVEPDSDGCWVLHDASIQRWDASGNLLLNTKASTNFERLKTLHKKMELTTTVRPIDLETGDLDISYLSWTELKTQYQRQPQHRHLAVKLHHHFAFPLSHVILLLLGIPFVLNTRNRNRFLSLALSFLICALFHLVSSISLNIANHSEVFSPVLAAWLPVMLFGSLGITLFDNLPT